MLDFVECESKSPIKSTRYTDKGIAALEIPFLFLICTPNGSTFFLTRRCGLSEFSTAVNMSIKSKKTDAKKHLTKKFGPMTFGMFIQSLREADEISLSEFASKLHLSRANLCDLEKGRKIPTPDRAARIAKLIGVPEMALIKLALQDSLRDAKLNYEVEIKKAS